MKICSRSKFFSASSCSTFRLTNTKWFRLVTDPKKSLFKVCWNFFLVCKCTKLLSQSRPSILTYVQFRESFASFSVDDGNHALVMCSLVLCPFIWLPGAWPRLDSKQPFIANSCLLPGFSFAYCGTVRQKLQRNSLTQVFGFMSGSFEF